MTMKKKLTSAKTRDSGRGEMKKSSVTRSKSTRPANKIEASKPGLTTSDTKPVKRATTRKTRVNGTKPLISIEQRHSMISNAAYLLSLKRDPCNGCPDADWLNAETVIDMLYDVKI